MPIWIAEMSEGICSLCQSGHLEVIFDLPDFPFTGIFVDNPAEGLDSKDDLSLTCCSDCGHLQLGRYAPPAVLYDTAYSYRSTASYIAGPASDFVARFALDICKGGRYGEVLEFGCNDLLLLNKLAPFADHLTGIDPIWRDRTPENAMPNISVVGGLLEDIELGNALEKAPDLIISTHALEHIVDPIKLLADLWNVAADDALFILEVPDADAMIANLRFDQVFHQHVHYFNLSSMLQVIDQLGGTYFNHCYNHRNWGGSFTIAFSKGRRSDAQKPESRANLEAPIIRERYALFRQQMNTVATLIDTAPYEIWGYGAGQMAPAVAYHMQSDLAALKGIYDDNPARAGLYFPGLAPQIHQPGDTVKFDDIAIAILALDNVVPIVSKLESRNPRHIILPSHVF